MASPHTQPTEPMPEWGYAEPPKRRRWPWVVVVLVVIVLGVVAWFAAEAAARDIVEKTIAKGVVDQLGLPADQEVDVEVAGTVIPQLIVGRLNDVTISADDVSLDVFTGDVTVNAKDVSVREPYAMSAASATVSLDEEQLQALMSTVDGFPADTLGLAAPDVTMSVELSLFSLSVPVSVALTPSAADGDLVLAPASLSVADADVTAESLRSRFGALADVVLRDWTVCVAQYLPAGATLTSTEVTGDLLIADFAIDPMIVSDTTLREKGSCE